MPPERQDLRQQLLSSRQAWMESTAGQAAQTIWGEHLRKVLDQLEPGILGVYWPIRSEFNPLLSLGVAAGAQIPPNPELALPYAQKAKAQMHYRKWDGRPPVDKDECGIPTAQGALVVPDVVLVPCVGYTAQGVRLGYGGGYFDRWLQAHPGVTAVGLAWSQSRCEFKTQPHDVPLSLIVTEQGVVD